MSLKMRTQQFRMPCYCVHGCMARGPRSVFSCFMALATTRGCGGPSRSCTQRGEGGATVCGACTRPMCLQCGKEGSEHHRLYECETYKGIRQWKPREGSAYTPTSLRIDKQRKSTQEQKHKVQTPGRGSCTKEEGKQARVLAMPTAKRKAMKQ